MRRRGGAVAKIACAALVVCLALSGCGVDEYSDASQDAGEDLTERVASGLSVKAQRGGKTLDIHRSRPAGTKPAGIEANTWTVFVYLCGSDLETDGGAATRDLAEMVGASGSENVRFVVEAGGAKQWRGNVGGKKLCRYVVQDGSIMEVDRAKAGDMGSADTLADFLQWGLKNYPAEHMGIIMWDHGGGSISGVCFDELNQFDSLMLRELDMAFARINPIMWQKFDFVGFDACLMGTLETANVLASYADYMYASQEIEPGTGWEYSSIVEHLAQHPDCTADELGRVVADNYLESTPYASTSTATLSIVDLSQVDDLVQSFYRFSQEMYESGDDAGTLAAMTRGIRQADKFGNNNWLEGYSNMVDLGGIVQACAPVTPSADDVRASLGRAVTYEVHGRSHAAASGLSIYYPLSVGDSSELTAFQSVALNPSYLSYVDRLAHGATYDAGPQFSSYTDDSWYDDGGLWSMLLDDDMLSLMLSMRSAPQWQYVDEHDPTSKIVSFATEPEVDSAGVYWMQFDEDGISNVASVSGLVYAQDADQQRELGETYDVYADWDTGVVQDGFDGKWLSLPDGQSLCLYVVESTEDEVVFTSPVSLNGEDRFLRLHQDLVSGEVTVEGVWGGEGPQGLVDRGSGALNEGDRLVPQYGTDRLVSGTEFVVGADGLSVDYGPLAQGSYRYAFNITDVFGDRLVTDTVEFEIEGGDIYFVM